VGVIDMNTAWSRTETHDPTDWDAAYDVAATTHHGPLPPPPASRDEPAPTPVQPDIVTADTDTTDTDAAQEPMFPTLEEWVTDYLAPIITTELGPGLRWCAQWWRHAAAIAVLEATWRAWEHLRTAEDPTAMSVWWRDHALPHLSFLTESPLSPFRQCCGERGGQGHSDELQPLPLDPAPFGWFG
jgi:hypothetical protein